jgi:hypothetical protein
MAKRELQILCKSVFKSGENMTSKERFTKAWIELVNQLERNKRTISPKR